MSEPDTIRARLRNATLRDEQELLAELVGQADFSQELRTRASERAIQLVSAIRADKRPGLLEVFLSEYGLSTAEGVALMCLAEALLRVPDATTIDALIEDKIVPSAWAEHLGKSSSPLVNASTWALMLTGRVLRDGEGVASTLKAAVRRLGEPVIRAAVQRAMRELGEQFVLGETIDAARDRAGRTAAPGYRYSFDMLGEAALTAEDAAAYFRAYADAIGKLGEGLPGADTRTNPGISIKLSALHPRYGEPQRDRVLAELGDSVLALARQAREAGIGLTVDAEEADRLDLYLSIIERTLRSPDLSGWDGFGIVVQAYGKRAPHVIEWIDALAGELDRRVTVRLVKGAYWDTEIKRAQVQGLKGFPVYTRKAATDVAYLCCAKKLLAMMDRIYPQFATHNAHTVGVILELARGRTDFEFQRLHGMGEVLHDLVLETSGVPCRIYAPVGAHRDLLAYLVRRLLENGANSSFVHQIMDEAVSPEAVAADPFNQFAEWGANRAVVPPGNLFGGERQNSRGLDLHDVSDVETIDAARAPFRRASWRAAPALAVPALGAGTRIVTNPANSADRVGEVTLSAPEDVEAALANCRPWTASVGQRSTCLVRASYLMEARFGEFFSLLAREAGKTPLDAQAEVREAVDFLRYYAARAEELHHPQRGVFACISPWNFPIAIFTGQVAAALAAGNAVLAKPAETTCLLADQVVRCMHDAGIPRTALQLLPGPGRVVGARITSDPRVDGVCFTGSTATAQSINRAMTGQVDPGAPLIAETGGINAMIVDSTALPEQAVRDIVASAFQSAGQRCSALRMLYLQQDVADAILEMLTGAMDELVVGDPWAYATDVGPVIDESASTEITQYIEAAHTEGRLLKQLTAPSTGNFVGPALIKVRGIADLEREVFGPVLHVATFAADDIDALVDEINTTGFGLTFGMHSRIDRRVERVLSRLRVGNAYVNRNQIGAIVGSQPFGGEGLSGTGPKAGGLAYVRRFTRPGSVTEPDVEGAKADPVAVQSLLDQAAGIEPKKLGSQTLPGPTGESNRLSVWGRGVVLCLGPSPSAAVRQRSSAEQSGCPAVVVAPGANGDLTLDGVLDRAELEHLQGFCGVALWSDVADQRHARMALAKRDGPLLPLWTELDLDDRCVIERHVCVDTTAAGGNASLLLAASNPTVPAGAADSVAA